MKQHVTRVWEKMPALPRPLVPMRHAVRRLFEDDGVEVGAFIAYTGLVSLFPFVIFLFALAGFVGETERAQAAVTELLMLMPSEVAKTIRPIIEEVLASPQPGLLTVGIVGTLWVTSSGVEAMRMGLNRAYDVKEKRPLWKRRLSSFAFVILGAVAMLVLTVMMVGAPLFEEWLKRHVVFPHALLLLSVLIRVVVTAGALAAIFAFFYRVLPNHRIGWSHAWPGAGIAAFTWIALASFFSVYLANAGHYAVTYGSLGGVVITLLFLHFSAIIVLFGAEFNAALKFDADR